MSPQPPELHTMLPQLLGAWTLESYTFLLASNPFPETGINPWSTASKGLIIYSPTGYMSVQLLNPGQPHYASPVPSTGTEAERAESAKRYIAYTGRFNVETDGAGEFMIVHEAEVTLFPNWVGTRQRRVGRLEDGGRKLVLRPEEPVSLNGEERMPTMVWRKLEAHDPLEVISA